MNDPNQLPENSHGQKKLPAPEAVIPHRPPMLFVSEIEQCSEDAAIGKYQFSAEDPIFDGHFPNRPIVPGVLILEGAAQTLAYWALRRSPKHIVLLTGVERAKWSHPVYPEEELFYKIQVVKAKLGLVIADVTVHINDHVALTARLKGYLQSK